MSKLLVYWGYVIFMIVSLLAVGLAAKTEDQFAALLVIVCVGLMTAFTVMTVRQ